MRTGGVLAGFALALALGVQSPAPAHHPANIERCATYSFTGQIERIEWGLPHVELFIRSDQGMVYQTTWLATNQLFLVGIDETTLQVGDRVEVRAGVLPNDVVIRPMLLSYIRRIRDGWQWSQRPEGC